jgi:Carboxypeptidase regulatory-like domain
LTRTAVVVIAGMLMTITACHPGPVLDSDPLPVGGTIAGIVATSAQVAVPGRTVAAVSTSTGRRFEARTGVDGGYTIQVPRGTYRLEIVLQASETILKQPGEIHITRSDVDASRDFVIAPRVTQGGP